MTIGHFVAKQKRLTLKIEAPVEGELNTDVFMGENKDIRTGFSGIRVHAKIDADMSQQEEEQFLREVDVRCPISDNTHSLTPIDFVVE